MKAIARWLRTRRQDLSAVLAARIVDEDRRIEVENDLLFDFVSDLSVDDIFWLNGGDE